jgi:polyamine oxidase
MRQNAAVPLPLSRRSFLGASALTAAAIATGSPAAFAGPKRAPVPAPIASLVTRWDRDPWSRGAYSALPIGATARVRQVLARAIVGDRMVFAGEYADPDSPSTVQGALRSGQRAARQLISRGSGGRIIVVGAGVAGLSAAHDLTASGADVVVLEARTRIGGRVHTDMSWGVPVEMGAAWVHALRGNPLVGLAAQANLALVPSDYDNEIILDTTTGRRSPAAERASDQVIRLLDQLEGSWPDRNMSVGTWLRQHGLPTDRFTTWAVETGIVQEYGLDAGRLGSRSPTEGGDFLGGDAFVSGGYQHIPDLLATGIDVRLDSAVAHVDISQSSQVSVTLESGEVMRADAAVMAVPISLLQAQAPGITGLPPAIRAAIQGIATGDLEKVILRYDEQWWGSQRVFGIVGGGVPGQLSQRGPHSGNSQSALRWTEFYSLTDVAGVPALVGFSGGSAARQRPKTDAACTSEAVAMLQAAFH